MSQLTLQLIREASGCPDNEPLIPWIAKLAERSEKYKCLTRGAGQQIFDADHEVSRSRVIRHLTAECNRLRAKHPERQA